MDWANDDARLSHNASGVRPIFRYDPRPTKVIKLVWQEWQNGYCGQVWSLQSHGEWTQWLNEHMDYSDRGLVLILADRTESVSSYDATRGPLSIESWLAKAKSAIPSNATLRYETTFASLGEKNRYRESAINREYAVGSKPMPRSIMHLPFAQDTFDMICRDFQVHKSIVRSIARRDVPSFSCEQVKMGLPAFVYNYRTPSTWASDLALSATYYPQTGLTFAIVYGSSAKVERDILERLASTRTEAGHPLLLPGILAELELIRHTQLVENSINEVEERILELNYQSNNARDLSSSEIDHRNQLKRASWLNLTYLRNSLSTWSAQLLKMAEHTETLYLEEYNTSNETVVTKASPNSRTCGSTGKDTEYPKEAKEDEEDVDPFKSRTNSVQYDHDEAARPYREHDSGQDRGTSNSRRSFLDDDSDSDSGGEKYPIEMRKAGEKIKIRLAAMRDDYEEKIRDCTMRVDGMAMATQWTHSETAVEIALATSQDSKVMRSISLVTMIFLPGTFFATVFSMTFFNWFDDDGKTRVSSYLWIYVVVTIIFTAITIGLWYFFVLFRRNSKVKGDEENSRIE